MNTKLAIRFIETLEPMSRRLVEKCEKDDKYMARWYAAYLQAKMVIRAYDTKECKTNTVPYQKCTQGNA